MTILSKNPGSKRENESFPAVYRRHMDAVYGYVAWRVGDRATAEDITADVFERAFRSWSRFDPSRASARTWLAAIARNAVADHFRRPAPQPGGSAEEMDTAAHSGGSGASSTFSVGGAAALAGGGDPLPLLEGMEDKAALVEAVSGLEAREREVLSLKFGAQMPTREIAAAMDVSESNVGTILYRSLGKLKTRLESEME